MTAPFRFARAGRSRATALTLAVAEIDHLRMDTRLDLSVRTTVVLTSGERLRIPPAAQPPHRDFEQALTARRVAVRRHHFTAL